MGGYIANFTVYTMAMIGLICFAVFVYKKFTDGSMRGSNTKFLSVEDSMSLSPRKTLHVVRAGNEKFLIASDIDRTTLISKLDENKKDTMPKNLERFKNIEPEELQQIPVYNSYEQIEYTKRQPEIKQAAKKVHLEPISMKNPDSERNSAKLDRRAGNLPNNVKNIQRENRPVKMVTLDFNTPQDHGFSTMREMAKKINEL